MKATQEITVHGQATIMAHSAANTYAVRFDANTKAAVMGEMEDQDMVYGEPQNLFANQFIRADATFMGWNTEADGSGVAYPDGQSVENLTKEDGKVVTLYAQWKETPAKSALLTFNLDGGTLDGKTGTVTVEANVGDTIKLPGAPTKKGYAFKFWKGSEYAAGAEYKVEGDHAFTAEWDKNAPVTHTVTFDANGHGKAPDAQTVEHGEKAKKPANPTADGYTFGGWYTDKDCKEAYDFSKPVTEDVTLYAKWTKKSSSGSGTSPKTGDPLAGAFAIALALAAASALALTLSRRKARD